VRSPSTTSNCPAATLIPKPHTIHRVGARIANYDHGQEITSYMARTSKFRLWVWSTLLIIGVLVSTRMDGVVRANSPLQSYGILSVVISEVAWGGTAASPIHEWIELYNPGGLPIDLTDWRIVADDTDPNILLMGTIPAGGFFLLERLDDQTVSDVTADQLFSSINGLTDSGEVLRLFAKDNYLIDTANLDGGGWPAGSASPGYFSMERVAILPDDPSTWVTNNGVQINGSDANGDPLNGSPKQYYALWPATPTPTLTFTNTNTPTITTTPTSTNTFTESPTPTDTGTPTLTGTATSTPTPTSSTTANSTASLTSTSTASPTATATPSAPAHLVISEFRSRGPNGDNDEFVELYNPSGAGVNIGAWMIRKSSSCGTSITTLVTIPANTILLPGQHYLVAATSSSVTGADQTYPASLADNGGVALVTVSGTLVDQVGMCTSTQYQEGTVLFPLSGTSAQSYERKPGGATSCYDTDKNAGDFALISSANPQNKAGPIVMCAGVLPSTPTRTPTHTPTRTPTRAPTAFPGVVVINEFLPHPGTDWNSDGTANSGDEYIELINMGAGSVSLKNWRLDDGDGDSNPYTLPNVTLLPRQIAVFFQTGTGISLSDGGDTVRLFKPDGRTADIYTYPVVTEKDRAWCRLPDGTGVWTFACRSSPGKPNKPIESGNLSPRSTPEGEAAVTESTCLTDSLPQLILFAECNSPGSRIWGEAEGGEIWLKSRWKWNVFVQ